MSKFSAAGVRIKRAYDEPTPDDGERILVDRLWPRGLTRERLAIDAWMKELAPSQTLRKWFGHEPDRWEGFIERYRGELAESGGLDAVREIRKRAARRRVTLIYSARDPEHNQAAAILRIMSELDK